MLGRWCDHFRFKITKTKLISLAQSMSKRISNSFIEHLTNQVDIVSLINKRVPLKKAGRNMQACCPFHNEKTPSFSVSPEKNFYYCFGCGAKGNAISFLMNYEHLSFIDSVEKIAQENAIEVIYENYDVEKAKTKTSTYKILDDTAAFYEKNLFSNFGDEAQKYLVNRDLDGDISKKFRLGYSLRGNNLEKHFSGKYTKDELKNSTLISSGETGDYDQFRDRLMFPIRDPRGRVLGFGARSLGDKLPKYINSAESELFQKRFVLYGLYETLQTSVKIDSLIIVEGYMDVIALFQQGIFGAVASLGTAFTKEHINLAKKYTSKIHICFDGDNAGRKAAKRAVESILPAIDLNDEVRITFLPDGEDPDTLVKKIGKDAFLKLLEQGVIFSEYVYSLLIKGSNIESVEGKGEVASRAKKLFDNMPETIYKGILYDGFVKKIDLDIYNMPSLPQFDYPESSYDEQSYSQNNIPKLNYSEDTTSYGYQKTNYSLLIKILLEYPDFAKYAKHLDLLKNSQESDILILLNTLEFFQNNNKENLSKIYDAFKENQKKRLEQIETQEKIINQINNDENFEKRKERFKNEFVDNYQSLINKLQRKLFLKNLR